MFLLCLFQLDPKDFNDSVSFEIALRLAVDPMFKNTLARGIAGEFLLIDSGVKKKNIYISFRCLNASFK